MASNTYDPPPLGEPIGQVWRDIPGYPGYEASQNGKIRSKPHHTTKGNLLREHEGMVTLKVRLPVRTLVGLAWPEPLPYPTTERP